MRYTYSASAHYEILVSLTFSPRTIFRNNNKQAGVVVYYYTYGYYCMLQCMSLNDDGSSQHGGLFSHTKKSLLAGRKK